MKAGIEKEGKGDLYPFTFKNARCKEKTYLSQRKLNISNHLIENYCVTFGKDSRSTVRLLLANLFFPMSASGAADRINCRSRFTKCFKILIQPVVEKLALLNVFNFLLFCLSIFLRIGHLNSLLFVQNDHHDHT